jgi:uncharacterized SAM-binding protein YcdF (DUF218 family)
MAFILSKILWIVVAPGNLLLILIVAGLIALCLGRRRLGLVLATVGALGLCASAVLPVGEWLMMPLEDRIAAPSPMPPRVDGIIVLGGGVDETISAARSHPTVNHAADRLVSTAMLARKYPMARIVVDGGSSSLIPGGPTEAAAMAAFLIQEGVDAERITRESRSRNTYENAAFAVAEVKPQPGETWLLVTSAWHMPRALGCFRSVGWRVMPYPVDYKTTGRFWTRNEIQLGPQILLANLAVKEWIGLVVYRLMGRTDALIPG